jgi:hypothetical protein
MSASRVEDSESPPTSAWTDFKKWTYDISSTKAARWTICGIQGATTAITTNLLLDIIFPEHVFFDVVRWTSTVIVLGVTARQTSHFISSYYEQQQQKDLRLQIAEMKFFQLEEKYNTAIDTMNYNFSQILHGVSSRKKSLVTIRDVEKVEFSTQEIKIKIDELEMVGSRPEETSCLRIRRLLNKAIHPSSSHERINSVDAEDKQINPTASTNYHSTGEYQRVEEDKEENNAISPQALEEGRSRVVPEETTSKLYVVANTPEGKLRFSRSPLTTFNAPRGKDEEIVPLHQRISPIPTLP